jgi:hypothetical protein
MLTKDIKKGTKVQLRNGFTAKTMGSARGATCVCEVFGAEQGFFNECGSCYSHDIVGYWDENSNYHTDLEYSPGQLKCKKMSRSMGW